MLSTTTPTTTPTTTATATATFTAFLSSIPAGTPDDLLEAILTALGDLKSWRRLVEPSGAPKPCGFAEFSSQSGLMAAARLLPHIELYAGRRVSVKVDEQASARGAAVEGEEGEVQSFKETDSHCLADLVTLFGQRRMLHAVESSKRLLHSYDKIINDVQGERDRECEEDAKELQHREDKWLKEEAKVFREYHDYRRREASKRDLEADDECTIDLFHTDRPAWRKQSQGDRDDECKRLKHLVDSLPVEPTELFAHPIEWSNFGVDRMKVWLVRQRALLPAQADKVAGYMARRLTAPQIVEAVKRDSLLAGDDDGLLFTIRLWRWIILDTQLHTE